MLVYLCHFEIGKGFLFLKPDVFFLCQIDSCFIERALSFFQAPDSHCSFQPTRPSSAHYSGIHAILKWLVRAVTKPSLFQIH